MCICGVYVCMVCVWYACIVYMVCVFVCSISISVFIHVWMSMCICGVYICMVCVWYACIVYMVCVSSRVYPGYLQCFFTLFLNKALSLNLELTGLVRLVGSKF